MELEEVEYIARSEASTIRNLYRSRREKVLLLAPTHLFLKDNFSTLCPVVLDTTKFQCTYPLTGAVHFVDILLSAFASKNISQSPEMYPVLFRP